MMFAVCRQILSYDILRLALESYEKSLFPKKVQPPLSSEGTGTYHNFQGELGTFPDCGAGQTLLGTAF
jgi:hypothetical protein